MPKDFARYKKVCNFATNKSKNASDMKGKSRLALLVVGLTTLLGSCNSGQVMESDIDFISTRPSFSPIAYVTLCDDGSIERIKETNRTQSLIEEQLILLKKNNPSVNINYLSIFNNFARRGEDSFTVPFISSEKELKVSEFEIDREKMKKTAK